MTTPYTKLANAINAAAANGDVIDVSNIRADASGVRTIKVPKTTRSTKRWIVEFPAIVSDNYASYLTAINILGQEYSQFAVQYAQQFGTQPAVRVQPLGQVPTLNVTTAGQVPTLNVLTVGVPQSPKAVVDVNPQAAYLKLVTALNAASAAGKVVDVSKIEADATGIRTVVVPKSGKGTKRWVGNFPVISDNHASFRRAMEILGAEYLPYAEQYLALYGAQKTVRAPPTPRLTTVTVKSPRNLGPIITNFPSIQNVQLITIPTAGTAKGTVLRQPAIIQGTIVRPASPPRVPTLATRPASPPRVPAIAVPGENFNPNWITNRPASPRVPTLATRPASPRVPAIEVPGENFNPNWMTTRPASPPRIPTLATRPASPRMEFPNGMPMVATSPASPRFPTIPVLGGNQVQIPVVPTVARQASPQQITSPFIFPSPGAFQ